MTREIAETWEVNGVYALPVFSVESLYYGIDVITAIAVRQARALGENSQALVQHAVAEGLSALAEPGKDESLAVRVCERRLRDAVFMQLPSRDQIRAAAGTDIQFTLPVPLPAEVAQFRQLLVDRNLQALIERYPVRESAALVLIARALRFQNRGDYEKAALVAIADSAALQTSMRARLGALGAAMSA